MKKLKTSKKRGSRRKVARESSKVRIKIPRTTGQYSALSETAQETWSRVLHAISRMRSDKLSLQRASKEAGVSPRKVKGLAGSALRKDSRGRYRAKPKDRLLRVLIIPA